MSPAFPEINFKGELRPSQADVVKIAREQLDAGQRQLHIVAPPGSGKTVTGLYLWAEVIRQPALVLCPNSAIQSQWAARTDLFSADEKALPKHWVSTETEQPGLLTSLTYQSVTLPSRDDSTLDTMAVFSWVDHLIEKGVGHVHAAFTEIEPEGVEDNMVELSRDMLERVELRPHFRSLWKIGEPYHPEPILAVETNTVAAWALNQCHPLAKNGPKALSPKPSVAR